MSNTIVPQTPGADHLVPVFPTRACNNREWTKYKVVQFSDLTNYQYVQFTKSSSSMAYVLILDFDKHDAINRMKTLPVHPDWIIEGGERPGREGYAQCGYFIHGVNKNVMREAKKKIAKAYAADESDNDSYLRNPYYSGAKVTIFNTTPHPLEEIVEGVDVKAWALDENNHVLAEYGEPTSVSRGERVNYAEALKTTKNGARDNTLWKAVRQQVMRNQIEDKDEAMHIAHDLNNLLEEPLTDQEVERKVESVFKGKGGFSKAQSERGKKAAAHRTFKSNQLNEMRIAKHDSGMTWKQIADEEGKNLEAVERSVIRYRKRKAEFEAEENIDPVTGEVLS